MLNGNVHPDFWDVARVFAGLLPQLMAAEVPASLRRRVTDRTRFAPAVAVLDVYAKEPYTGPLTDLDNVILTPHIGSYAAEARDGMEVEAVHNLIDMLGEAS